MNLRQQRGQTIAETLPVSKMGESWVVPSQTGKGVYIVGKDTYGNPRCQCPDFDSTGVKCKHIFAVEFKVSRAVAVDGTITETKTLTVVQKTTYKQDWPAYNRAQSREKDRIQELLFDLCEGLTEPAYAGRGRHSHTVRDSIFSMVFKVYSTVSARRFSSDLRTARENGFLSADVPGLKVNVFMENADFTEILKSLIAKSAAPLKGVEKDFAIDSSGFGSNKFEKWFDHKYGVTRSKCVWVKAHIACGVKTNIVTAIRILDKDAADSPQFAPLVTETARTFTIAEVSADKAYTSLENFETVAGFGGTAFMAFKQNATGAKGGLFQKMFHYFQYKQEEYMNHYHKRSNVESTFSMMKRKFGDAVRSKSDVAMVNEVLCKVLAHNLCVLNQEECELGIEAMFSKANAEEKVLPLSA